MSYSDSNTDHHNYNDLDHGHIAGQTHESDYNNYYNHIDHSTTTQTVHHSKYDDNSHIFSSVFTWLEARSSIILFSGVLLFFIIKLFKKINIFNTTTTTDGSLSDSESYSIAGASVFYGSAAPHSSVPSAIAFSNFTTSSSSSLSSFRPTFDFSDELNNNANYPLSDVVDFYGGNGGDFGNYLTEEDL